MNQIKIRFWCSINFSSKFLKKFLRFFFNCCMYHHTHFCKIISDCFSGHTKKLKSKIYSISLRNSEETYSKAYSGHLSNQLRVQQLTRDGNIRHLTLSESPTGDIHNVICSLSLTLSVNVIKILSLSR